MSTWAISHGLPTANSGFFRWKKPFMTAEAEKSYENHLILTLA